MTNCHKICMFDIRSCMRKRFIQTHSGYDIILNIWLLMYGMFEVQQQKRAYIWTFTWCHAYAYNSTNTYNETKELAKERYDAEVYAILSDNAYNMQNMGAAARLQDLLYSTCNAHSGNLLAKDILKTSDHSKTMEKVMSVQKEFKKTSLEDRLVKAGGHKPKLSCATRWTSERNAAESFIKNLSPMKNVTGKTFLFHPILVFQRIFHHFHPHSVWTKIRYCFLPFYCILLRPHL